MDSGVIRSFDPAQLQDLEKAGFDRLQVLIDFMERSVLFSLFLFAPSLLSCNHFGPTKSILRATMPVWDHRTPDTRFLRD